MKIRNLNIKGKALCIFDDGCFLVYRKGALFLYSKEYKVMNVIELAIHPIKKALGKLRLCERLLHIEPRFAVNMGNHDVLLQLGKGILYVNTDTNLIRFENVSFRGRPLSYAKVEGLSGFSDSVLIGDYGSNEKGEAVNIYQRDSENGNHWKVAYTFEPGKIWHIHGFVPDYEKNCVYILTGDEDWESGIWIATDNFKNVVPLLIGNQQYRTCQISAAYDKIYYFTDAPSESNFLYSYDFEKKEVMKLASIKGTCIYGSPIPGGILVSTTCEPEAHFKSNIAGMITRRPGKGIAGREVDLLVYRNGRGLKTVKTFRHDGLPLKLFQYGTITFSNYNDSRVMFTPISVKKYDMEIFEIRGIV